MAEWQSWSSDMRTCGSRPITAVMAAREYRGMTTNSRLSKARLAAHLTQDDMAELTGISRSTYWRLEHGLIPNPPVRYLINCVAVLGQVINVDISELSEDEWWEWIQLPGGPVTEPDEETVRERRGGPAIA